MIPRCPFALSNKDYPEIPVAVLPVEVSPRVSAEHYLDADLRELGNQVLDTLAKSADENLIGWYEAAQVHPTKWKDRRIRSDSGNALGKGIDQAFRAAFNNMYRAKELEETPGEQSIAPSEHN